MADEAASLVVRITGDASDLERTISSVASKLESLGGDIEGVSDNVQAEVSDVADEVKKSTEEIQNDVSRGVKKIDDEIKKSAKKSGEELQKTGQKIRGTGEAIDDLTKPVQKASLLLAAGGVASAKFAMDFEDNFAAVEKTVDGSTEQLEKVKQGIIDLATVGIDGRNPLPISTAELTELAAIGGQLGFATDNIVEFTETMAQLGTATNLVGEEGAATVARFMNVMQVPQTEIRNVGSAVVDLGNHMATTESEIMEMANRMGKYGQTVKIGAADVMGYSAALSSLGVEAQLGGSAIGRTWLSIETAVAQGGEALEAFASYSGKSAEEFKTQWGENASGAFMDLLKGLGESENLTLALADVGINNTQDIQAIMSLASNYELVAEAVGRANNAYAENNALQTEADKKAETTASQLQIAKNNLTEMGRSIGEVMLPSINSGITKVTAFAQKLSGLSDNTKKTLVSVAGGVIGFGALAKGTASTTKTVGTLVEAFGKLKSKTGDKSGGGLSGGLKKIGSLISAMPPQLKIAAAAATALGIAGVAAYKAWYKAEYDWADGMREQSEIIGETADKVTQLNGLKSELGDLKMVVKNPESSQAEIEGAKARINEIAELLNAEYNMKINVDDGNLDGTIEKLETTVELLGAKKRSELLGNTTGYIAEIYDNIDKYAEAKTKLDGLYDKKADAEVRYNFMSQLASQAELYESKYNAGTISEEYYKNQLQRLAKQANDSGLGYINSYLVETSGAETFAVQVSNLESELEGTKKEIDKTKGSVQEFDEAAAKSAESLQKVLASDVAAGNDKNITADIAQFKELGTALQKSGADTDELSMKFAAAKSGFVDFDTAIQAGKADEMASAYMDFKKSIGESADESIKGAALIKSGFSDVESAVGAGDDAVKNVIKTLSELAGENDVGNTAGDLTEMAHAMELIPERAEVTVSADGDIEIIDHLQETVNSINESGNVTIKVNADGDVTKLETADAMLKDAWANNQVIIKVNADTSGFDIFNLNGEKAGEITAAGKINWNSGDVEKPTEDEVTAEATTNWKVGKVEKPTKEQLTVKGQVIYEAVMGAPKPNAKGTKNFSGGLAMVNDERGVADPRELVIDNGRAFIPQGRDVILPLSKGAKVYTAKQTKDLLGGMGIPKYAKGKDNSDAFVTARDNWSHYTKTHAVDVSEELAKWVELSKEYKSNAKDIEDIEEEIYSLKRKQNDELNKASESYINTRIQLNDWDAYGDDPLSAYKRIETRNLENVNNGLMTKSEFGELMTGYADDMLSGRIDQSFDWLDREQKYNNLSEDEYIAGIDRMMAYANEALSNTAISEETYNKIMTKLADERRDHEIQAAKEVVSAWEKSADNWLKIRETFNDWDNVGDSKSSFYMRSLKSIEELYQNGKLGWEEYMDMSQEAYLNYYKAEEERIDKELEEFRDLIDETEQAFADEEQALRDSWTVEDRETDKADVERLLGIYENSVTSSGQEKYKELLEQKKQIEREEELYNLEQSHQATLEDMEDEYKARENKKDAYLKTLHTDQFNIYSKTKTINTDTSNMKESLKTAEWNSMLIVSRLGEILSELKNREVNVYNDNRITSSGVSSAYVKAAVQKEVGSFRNTVITGASNVMMIRK